MLFDRIQTSPYWSLLAVFGCWKSLLGLIALVAPSPAYDTSTALALLQSSNGPPVQAASIGAWLLETICNSLTRWDAIFFIKVAERGYINEQEWAFGWGFTWAIVITSKVLSIIPGCNQIGHPDAEIACAILLSNACHLGSVFVLYQLTLLCSNNSSRRPKEMAWLVSVLHILSPAGLFLSAPYSESLFSFLAFTGTYIFAWSLEAVRAEQHLWGNVLTLLSATVFSVACTVRSNGLLNGILFLFEFATALFNLYDLKIWSFIRVATLGIGGLVIGGGLVLPQYIAYQEFCTSDSLRPWCLKLVPSIYTWVQDIYWNVGPFRYWTLSNLPLFLLATPTLVVLLQSGAWGLQLSTRHHQEGQRKNRVGVWADAQMNPDIVNRLAVAQFLLAVMAIIAYHVQIITRLSSGYVVWYWWIAVKIMDEGRQTVPGSTGGSSWILRWMVMYSLIQGVLFAGFLPPA
ncbi:GPI mannosyltransferase 2 [Trichophaea hybrida]|nr:GPI mannosyltransferase 2 [Trichophaea hybrida]